MVYQKDRLTEDIFKVYYKKDVVFGDAFSILHFVIKITHFFSAYIFQPYFRLSKIL